MLINAEESFLLVIDIQEKLLPTMHDPDQVVANTSILIKAAARLSVPVLVSEQYPKGLGATVGEVSSLAPPGAVMDKGYCFSCLGDENLSKRCKELKRPQAVIAGIEAHVCVIQTGMDMLDGGFNVFVVADATGSRTRENHDAALRRLGGAGAEIATTEMVLFEWLKQAGSPEFKELVRLIK